MPPPLFDDLQIHRALRNQALPDLEQLADNSDLRDQALRRFERDEPPPYVTSSESGVEEGLLSHPAMGRPSDSHLLTQLNALLDPPLDSKEVDTAVHRLQDHAHVYNAGSRFRDEIERERERVFRFSWSEGEYLTGRVGRQRSDVIVRRNIRKRWEKLGVWNPQWGIPGRVNAQDNDDVDQWKWSWQQGSFAADWQLPDRTRRDAYRAHQAGLPWHEGIDEAGLNPQHPIVRAVQLRQGLHRGEHTPLPPRSHLKENAPPAEAESFIISRPWFMFQVECSEESRRLARITDANQGAIPIAPGKNIIEMWLQRGDWKETWPEQREGEPITPGWKWRHESPSPEPEDLTQLNPADLDYSPSEIDALEAIPPPTPPPERHRLPSDESLGTPGDIFYIPRRRPRLSPSAGKEENIENRTVENGEIGPIDPAPGLSPSAREEESTEDQPVENGEAGPVESVTRLSPSIHQEEINEAQPMENGEASGIEPSARPFDSSPPPPRQSSPAGPPDQAEADATASQRSSSVPAKSSHFPAPKPVASAKAALRQMGRHPKTTRPIPARRPAEAEGVKVRGRPRTASALALAPASSGVSKTSAHATKPRGRPRKDAAPAAKSTSTPKTATRTSQRATAPPPAAVETAKGRGRPKKDRVLSPVPSRVSKPSAPATKTRGRPRRDTAPAKESTVAAKAATRVSQRAAVPPPVPVQAVSQTGRPRKDHVLAPTPSGISKAPAAATKTRGRPKRDAAPATEPAVSRPAARNLRSAPTTTTPNEQSVSKRGRPKKDTASLAQPEAPASDQGPAPSPPPAVAEPARKGRRPSKVGVPDPTSSSVSETVAPVTGKRGRPPRDSAAADPTTLDVSVAPVTKKRGRPSKGGVSDVTPWAVSTTVAPVARKRGRPSKGGVVDATLSAVSTPVASVGKKKGRPSKGGAVESMVSLWETAPATGKRGRPSKEDAPVTRKSRR